MKNVSQPTNDSTHSARLLKTGRRQKTLSFLVAAGAALSGFISAGNAMAEPPDRAKLEAAAKACGMPERGSGVKPTTEQEACMTKAGFPKPKGPHGHHGGRPPGPPPAENDSGSSSDTGSTGSTAE